MIKGGIVHKFKLKHLALALSLVALPYSAMAAGLGKLNIMSSLGEPLRAEIELISASPAELSSLTANIAPLEAYQQQKLDKPESHNNIQVTVKKNALGLDVLELKSNQAITDPFLDMLIQVDWASGRLLREYTLLLDPPGYKGEVLANTTVASPPTTSTVKKSNASSAQATAKPVETQPYDENAQHTTVRGDTLSNIARRLKPEGVSLEQMLVGLYQANPEAFSGKNMNRLKVGQIIRVPSQEAIQALSQKAARKEVHVHTTNWNEYKNKLAGVVNESTVAKQVETSQTTSGKVLAAEDKATPSSNEPKDVVKLSAGSTDKDKKAAIQEDMTAKENAVKEDKSKSAELEKQIEDMKKLMALKNDAMAKVQEEASAKAENKTTAEVAGEPVADTTKVAVAPVEQPVTKPAVKEVAAKTQEPKGESKLAFLTDLLQNNAASSLGVLGGGLALLGGAWLFLRNRRKKNLASFEEGIMTTGGLKQNTVFGNTAGGTVDTGDTSFLTDFSRNTTGNMIAAHDVDPIAEAEVYMAYGRDAQAEEILKDAIAKEPERYELHSKLLEIYHSNTNVPAFNTVASELYTTLGAESPIWAKVAEMGVKLDPTNPLYQGATVSAEAPSEVPTVDGLSSDALETLTEEPMSVELDNSFAELEIPDEVVATPKADSVPEIESDLVQMEFVSSTSVGAVAEASKASVKSVVEEDDGLDEVAIDTAESFNKQFSSDADGALEVDFASLDFDESTIGDTIEFSAAPASTPKTEVSDKITADNLEFKTPETVSVKTEVAALDVPMLDFSIDKPVKPDIVKTTAIPNATPTSDVSDVASKPSAQITVDEFSDLDLDDEISVPAANGAKNMEAEPDMVSLNLSEIDLDLNSDDNTEISINAVTEDEPEEVETKLDLAMAYLDMDDKIGAKELLDEVMKEGGDHQRQRASELLSKIA